MIRLARESLRAAAPLVFVLVLAQPATAQPTLTSLNAAELTRGGRMVLRGSGFGEAVPTSRVEVSGLEALFTTWTDERIVAWVPEGAALGGADVRVITALGSSNTLPLTVRLRAADGRVRWRFEADTDNLWYRPALAPDGTLYLHSSEGFIYALSPTGALLWTSQVIWVPYVAPSAGPDGTLYVGSIDEMSAFSSAGELLWKLVDPGAQAIQASLAVGPDGNVYGATDPGSSGFGAFSVTPAGDLRWTNGGDPTMSENGGDGSMLAFGPSVAGGPVDQVYIGMDNGGTEHLYAMSLDGEQRWSIPVGPNSDAPEPVIGSDGTLYTSDFIAAGPGWVVRGFDPADGSERMFYDGDPTSFVSHLQIGPDDTLYYISDSGRLEALDPHTETLRWERFTGDVLGRPELSPDATTIVTHGVANLGETGFIKAFSSTDGAELWSVPLPGEPFPGTRVSGSDRARFTPDSRTAYVSTSIIASDPEDEHSFLYVVTVGEPCTVDLDGNGVRTGRDFLVFREATQALDPVADFNGDGQIDRADRQAFRAAWMAGCS